MARSLPRKPIPNFNILIACADGVPERWTSEYADYAAADKREITRKLQSLTILTVEEVDKIIGNSLL